MRVTFLGVGEGYDRTLNNTSLLVQDGSVTILLDCGVTAIGPVLKACERPDLVFISHFHPDHIGGLPRLVMQGRVEGWRQPLRILGGKGIQERFHKLFEAFYDKRYLEDLPYTLMIAEVSAGEIVPFAGLSLRIAGARHMAESVAVRVAAKSASVTFSGDSLPSDAIADLAEGTDLLVHDCYFGPSAPKQRVHATWAEAVDVARKAQARRLAMLHVRADQRSGVEAGAKILQETFDGKILVPLDGDVIEL